MDQVIENVESANRSGTNILSKEELSLIANVQEEYRKRLSIPCTNCRYCLPCPNNVNIPGILGLYNDLFMYDDLPREQFWLFR